MSAAFAVASSVPAAAARSRGAVRGRSAVGLPSLSLRRRSAAKSFRVQASARDKVEDDMLVNVFRFALDEAASKRAILGAGTAVPLLFAAQDAFAKGGEFGILEGRTGALIHPAMMFFLFFATGYTGYLGLQWRRVRELGDEINTMKATMPAAAEGAAAAAVPSEAEAKVAELAKERKELIAGGFKDKHFNWGSLLLGLGVAIAIEGPINTYLRTGKLFPGPHLYAGAAITVLWALAAALVPAMQKGNSTARSMHIGLNCINLALFAWQVPTGIEIVLKVFQFTSWP